MSEVQKIIINSSIYQSFKLSEIDIHIELYSTVHKWKCTFVCVTLLDHHYPVGMEATLFRSPCMRTVVA